MSILEMDVADGLLAHAMASVLLLKGKRRLVPFSLLYMGAGGAPAGVLLTLFSFENPVLHMLFGDGVVCCSPGVLKYVHERYVSHTISSNRLAGSSRKGGIICAMIFVDSHVHIYDCFDVDLLLDSAIQNFHGNRAKHRLTEDKSPGFVLLLTEGAKEGWFRRTVAALEDARVDQLPVGQEWYAAKTNNPGTLVVTRKDSPKNRLYLVAGQQVVTRENIEVLGLYSPVRIKEDLSLAQTVAAVRQAGGIPVLPWGVGKWFGKRGKMIQDFLETMSDSDVYIGDNGGRPRIWPTPALMRLAARKGFGVLPGSDALPLPDEACRTGSYGFYLDLPLSEGEDPSPYLKSALLSRSAECIPFGCLQHNCRFICNQLRLQLSSRRSS